MKSVERMVSSINQNHRLSNVLTLKEGQLITGKISKFFPGNKAAVSLSGHQLIAQLDASLEANKHYLMQVKGTQPSIQLKVVQQQEVRSYTEAAQQLAQANNEKASRNIQLQLAQLLKQQLPIKPNQISPLIQLMKQHQVPNQNEILSTIIKQNLPLSRDTFQAVHQRMNQPISISQSITNIQNQLSNMPVTEETYQLNQRLSILNSKPINLQQFQNSVAFQAIKELSQGSSTMYQLFKKAGVISDNISFEQWTNQWKNWSQQGRVTFNFSNPTVQSTLPFNLKADVIANLMNQFTNTSQSQMTQQENRALTFWQAMSSLLNNEQNNQRTLQLKSFFQLVQTERSVQQDYPSIQSLLKMVQLQVGQSSVSEPIQQLNQVLNAMHLSNQELTRDFMSFMAQLPKETLGLNQDLYMEFEGYKQKDGQLSPHQCRVIFYLDLPKLNQTVMDMHVQKNHIELTIFHEQPELLRRLTKPLIPKMEENLEDQGFTSVLTTFKELHEKETKTRHPLDLPMESGVDYRI